MCGRKVLLWFFFLRFRDIFLFMCERIPALHIKLFQIVYRPRNGSSQAPDLDPHQTPATRILSTTSLTRTHSQCKYIQIIYYVQVTRVYQTHSEHEETNLLLVSLSGRPCVPHHADTHEENVYPISYICNSVCAVDLGFLGERSTCPISSCGS